MHRESCSLALQRTWSASFLSLKNSQFLVTGIALVIMVPLQSPATSTGSCPSFTDWRSDSKQAQVQRQEGGRSSLPNRRAAVIKHPSWCFLSSDVTNMAFASSQIAEKATHAHQERFWVVLNVLSGEALGSQSGRAALDTQKCCSRYLDRCLTQTLSGLGSSWFLLYFWPAGTNFTSAFLWAPKSSCGMSPSLNSHFPGAKHLSNFHFYWGAIHPLSLPSL